MLHTQICFRGHSLRKMPSWDDDCKQAFETLKKALVQPPVLAYPMRDGHFVLSTDASDTGKGAVLQQEQEKAVELSNG